MIRIEVSVAEGQYGYGNKERFERLLRQAILREVAALADEVVVSVNSVKFIKPKYKPRTRNSTSE